MLRPIEKQRVAEGIVEQLRSLILTGKFAPGEKLPPERNLAKELGVNRSSLREALKKLEHLGLVKIRQGDGTRVQDFMQTAGIDLVSYLIPLSSTEGRSQGELVKDVLEFRRIYGREVARLAAIRAEASDLDKLREIADAADAPGLSAEDVLRIDFDFYVALTRAAKNRVFILLINTTRQAIMAYAPFFGQLLQDAEGTRKHHRALIKALIKHDAAGAAEIADGYLLRGAEMLLGPSK